MLRSLVLVGLFLATLVALGTEAWVHGSFGIVLPWDTPRFFHVCGRQYEQGPAGRDPATTYTFFVRPTIFDLPIPMPDVAPLPGVANWGGCPLQVILRRSDGDVVYAFIQGGP